MLPEDQRHGTNAGHIAGCRDTCCRTAHATYRRGLRAKRYLLRADRLYIDATSTTRRIRALQAIGWRLSDIDVELGHPGRDGDGSRYTANLTTQARIHVTTARAVAAVYDRLSMTPGPSARTRALARRYGWPPPLAWDDIDRDPEPIKATGEGHPEDRVDHAVVYRVVNRQPRPRRLTRAETEEVTAILTARGVTANEIERGYGINVWRRNRRVESEAS